MAMLSNASILVVRWRQRCVVCGNTVEQQEICEDVGCL
jgi:rRNA maturation endonuclease Nob1